MRITVISDTHTLHKQITKDLPGGDLIIHAGDFTSMGYLTEMKNFYDWFTELKGYEEKIFIAGNHELGFQDNPKKSYELLEDYYSINYLQDDLFVYGEDYGESVKIWGSPWQPEFCNWAFNLPRNGEKLKEKWDLIPYNTNILVTHGPSLGFLDVVERRKDHLGCALLAHRIEEVKPQIHVFGHIHSGYGHEFYEGVHYINASCLNEQYKYTNKPLTFDWDMETNSINFL